MKIAIPSDDGFTIHQEKLPVKGFLVSTVQFGEVVQQDMRWIPSGENGASDKGNNAILDDCDTLIIRDMGSDQYDFLALHDIEIVKTEETIITNVLMQHIEKVMHKESNICCCP
jgi:predicted Fe-Mo cluster-binding NifX family protein